MAVATAVQVVDSDAHVQEWAETWSDKYLDFLGRRPVVVGQGERAYWLIDDKLFPAMVGPGCHILGTPTQHASGEAGITKIKPETIESQELRGVEARLGDMDREGLDVQVLYSSIFLAYPLTADVAYYQALARAYNNWIADVTAPAPDRLKWVGVTNLEDADFAADELRRTKQMGAVGVHLLGTHDVHQLSEPRFEPFFAEAERLDMPIAIHVGWSCPPLNQLFDTIWSAIVARDLPVQMALYNMIGSGFFDRHPRLRVGFLEVGSDWLPYWCERMDEYSRFSREKFPLGYKAERWPQDYLRSGNIFVTCETEEKLLPQVVDLVGEDCLMYTSDMPHSDREQFNAHEFWRRTDLTERQKEKILAGNVRAFYGF
jgi:predicted TIM-barrel fold metal-dependent hydrolase